MFKKNLASWLLRLGLALALIYPAIGDFLNPIAWLAFVPVWARNIFGGEKFLDIFAIFEILLALWLIWGKKLRWSSLICAALMFAITIFNLASFEIVFRDISLGLAALALAALYRNKEASQTYLNEKEQVK